MMMVRRSPLLAAYECSGFQARLTLAALAMAFLSVGCSQTTVVLPSRDLDRPTDMAFACLRKSRTADGKVFVSGQPMDRCHPSGVQEVHPGETEGDPTTGYRTYAFVPNAERGDLSVIDMSYCRPDDAACYPPGARLVDLDPAAVGFGGAPLGVLPEAIAASQDGCRVVTANRGSCDLSLIDPSALLAFHLDPKGELAQAGTPAANATDAVSIIPRHGAGRLLAAPGEVAFVPQQTGMLPPAGGMGIDPGSYDNVCGGPTGLDHGLGTLAPPVGDPAPGPGQRVPWRAVVTFPSCDLVTLMELPSGTILDSYRIQANNTDPQNVSYELSHVGANPVCPHVDCALAGAGGTPGAADGGAAVPVAASTGLGLAGLAIHPEGNRVFFGATNAPFVFALDLAGTQFVEPPVGKITALHAGAGGTVRLRLSVDPYAYSKGHDANDPARPQLGRFVAGRHDVQPADPLEFLYVIAKDGSLRILDVATPQPVECDIGIDPGDPQVMAATPDAPDAARKACFEYKDVRGPNDPRRLQSAGIPGHRFPSPVQDVAFANYRTPPLVDPASLTTTDLQLRVDDLTLSGAFAFAMTNGGTIYVLNIDPELRRVSQVWRDASGTLFSSPTEPRTRVFESPRPLTHTVRDFNVQSFANGLATQVGPPRVETPPSAPVEGPHLLGVKPTETRIDARLLPYAGTQPDLTTYVYFPNYATVHPQTWHVDWEGDLTGVRVSGDIISAPDPSNITTEIVDNGAGFCPLGGAEGDIMTLIGCETDTACPVGNVCVHSQQVAPMVDGRAISGMCLPRLQKDNPACEPMLETFRRYEITSLKSDASAVVVPRRAELARPAHDDPAAGGRVSCDVALETGTPSRSDCRPPGISPIYAGFKCVPVQARPDGSALRGTDLHARCLWPCGADDINAKPCRPGQVCLKYPNDGSYCAEAAPIVESCGLDQLFSYKLSAGNSFVVNGSVSGRTESFRPQATPAGPVCVRDEAIPTMVARIPMNAPTCDPGSTPSQKSVMGTPLVGDDPAQTPIRNWDDAFLGRVAAPPYPSPNPCLVFEGVASNPPNPDVPLAVSALFENSEMRFVLTDLQKAFGPTLQIQFAVSGGVAPQQVFSSSDANPGLPARILLGPVPASQQQLPKQNTDPPLGVCIPPTNNLEACEEPGLFSDLPYLFVVDQRQFSAGRLGARGQVLRITPRVSTNSPYAGFESFTGSGKYFPIQ